MAAGVTATIMRAVPPDWRDPAAYAFVQELSRERWAWEFLRRNPDYVADWAWFSATWQALEADYGKPPDRDFARWKHDPRAYRAEHGAHADDPDACGQNDADLLLIECWMGSKWGYYKFPLDPAVDTPIIGEQLVWRAVTRPARELKAGDVDYLDPEPGHDRSKLALGFDLSLPLKEQLETARIFLAARQASLRQAGEISPRTVASCAPRWTLCLRALDARSADASGADAAKTLFPHDPAPLEAYYALSRQADALARGGFHSILSVPER